ncbi:hypothetical protein D9M68_871560 [compost metagenome]
MYITGLPPAASMAGARRCVHLTSNRMGAPGTRESTSCANSIICRSGKMLLPPRVMMPRRSPSPSKARPRSAPVSFSFAIRSRRFSGLLGSGWWLGKLPSTSLNSSITSQPIARKMPGAEAPATPLPESTTIFSGRASLMSPAMRSRYGARMLTLRTVPGFAAGSPPPLSISRRRPWISSP